MNIRNLLFTSMILCTVPVVCVTSCFAKSADKLEVSLTNKEKENIKDWVLLAKDLSKKTQSILKSYLTILKDQYVFGLSKMQVGKPISEYKKEESEVQKIFRSKLDELFRKNEQVIITLKDNPLKMIFVLTCCPLPFLDEYMFDDEKTTSEKHIVIVKKAIAMYSFALEWL